MDGCRGKALAVLLLVFVGGAASGMIGSHVFQSVTPATPVVKTPDDSAEISTPTSCSASKSNARFRFGCSSYSPPLHGDWFSVV